MTIPFHYLFFKLGLLLTGGGGVELYNPFSKTSCALPALPRARSLHSQDGPLLCGGNENTHLKPWKSCLLFNLGIYGPICHDRSEFELKSEDS